MMRNVLRTDVGEARELLARFDSIFDVLTPSTAAGEIPEAEIERVQDMIGVPIFLPPLAPACVEQVTQRRTIHVPGQHPDQPDNA